MIHAALSTLSRWRRSWNVEMNINIDSDNCLTNNGKWWWNDVEIYRNGIKMFKIDIDIDINKFLLFN